MECDEEEMRKIEAHSSTKKVVTVLKGLFCNIVLKSIVFDTTKKASIFTSKK